MAKDNETFNFLPEFDTEDIPEPANEVEGEYFARIVSLDLRPPTETQQNPCLMLKAKYEGNGEKVASDNDTLIDSLPPLAVFYNIPTPEDRGVMLGANKTTDKAEMLLRNLKYLFQGLGYENVDNKKLVSLCEEEAFTGKLITFKVKFAENKTNPDKPYKNYNYIKLVKES